MDKSKIIDFLEVIKTSCGEGLLLLSDPTNDKYIQDARKRFESMRESINQLQDKLMK